MRAESVETLIEETLPCLSTASSVTDPCARCPPHPMRGMASIAGMNEPQTVRLPHGDNLRCDTCGRDVFEEYRWKLQTTGMTFFNLDWANRDATCYVCTSCRRIHWFHL
jgi:hypothetical protein